MKKLVPLVLVFLLAACGTKTTIMAEEFNSERYFNEANRLIEEKDYEDAKQVLHEIKRRDLEVEYAPLAQLRLADVYLAEEELEVAVEEYRRFLHNYPRHKHAAYAQYQIAQIYYGMIEGPDRGFSAAIKALEAFKTLQGEYPRNPYREKVDFNIEHCREILADHEFMVGDFYFEREAYKGALDRFNGLLAQHPDYPKEAEVLYRMAVSYRMLGDQESAERHLDRLIKKYPDSLSTKKAEEEFSKPLKKSE
jgi:outer membrane protein assembly factor BamD